MDRLLQKRKPRTVELDPTDAGQVDALVRDNWELYGQLEWALEHRHALRRWLEDQGDMMALAALDDHLTSGWVSHTAYALSKPRFTLPVVPEPEPEDVPVIIACPACGENNELPRRFCAACRGDLPDGE